MLLIKSKRLRDTIRVVVPFIAVPLITVLGALAFDEKKHIIIALAVAVSALLVFAEASRRSPRERGAWSLQPL